MKMNGKDLADAMDCSPGWLSEAARNGSLVHDRWDVGEWAVYGAGGRLKYYDVPDDVAFLNGSGVRSNSPNEGESVDETASIPRLSGDVSDNSILPPVPPVIVDVIKDQQETMREVARNGGSRTQLVPDGTDVAGTAKNAGLAYVGRQAVEDDTQGAHAFWAFGPALIFGLAAWDATESAFAAGLVSIATGIAGHRLYESSRNASSPSMGSVEPELEIEGGSSGRDSLGADYAGSGDGCAVSAAQGGGSRQTAPVVRLDRIGY
jgi:hypothetical protein